MSASLVLENNSGTKLYEDRLVYEGQTYLIADMKKVVIKSNLIESGVLLIEFNDGEVGAFNVGTYSTASYLNAFFSGGLINTFGQDEKASTTQWITAANMLINMKNNSVK